MKINHITQQQNKIKNKLQSKTISNRLHNFDMNKSNHTEFSNKENLIMNINRVSTHHNYNLQTTATGVQWITQFNKTYFIGSKLILQWHYTGYTSDTSIRLILEENVGAILPYNQLYSGDWKMSDGTNGLTFTFDIGHRTDNNLLFRLEYNCWAFHTNCETTDSNIFNVFAKMQIIRPNNNDIYTIGTKYIMIQWLPNSVPINTVLVIDLFEDISLSSDIHWRSFSTSNNGFYNFTLPSNLIVSINKFYFVLSCATIICTTVESNRFVIAGKSIYDFDSLHVLQGKSFIVGDQITLYWSYTGFNGNEMLQLSLHEDIPFAGDTKIDSFSIMVQQGRTGYPITFKETYRSANYKYFILESATENIYVQSDEFLVDSRITILSPTTSNTYEIGDQIMVTFARNSVPTTTTLTVKLKENKQFQIDPTIQTKTLTNSDTTFFDITDSIPSINPFYISIEYNCWLSKVCTTVESEYFMIIKKSVGVWTSSSATPLLDKSCSNCNVCVNGASSSCSTIDYYFCRMCGKNTNLEIKLICAGSIDYEYAVTRFILEKSIYGVEIFDLTTQGQLYLDINLEAQFQYNYTISKQIDLFN
jgi:hypothetical protein